VVRDHYEVLGVTSSATPDQIRAAHQRRTRELAIGSGAGEVTEALVDEALAVLTDPVRRSLYDRLAAPYQPVEPVQGIAVPGAPPTGARHDPPQPVPPPPMPLPHEPEAGTASSQDAAAGRDTGSTGRASKGLVAAGIAAAVGVVALVAALVVGWLVFGDRSNVFDLAVGTCFDAADAALGATEVAQVPIVDCAEPHDNEVYAAFDMTATEFPGFETAEQLAFNECVARFDTFVGVTWEDSELDFTYLYPTDNSWSRGDREIVCAIHRIDGQKSTGSLEGAGI